jgi:6-phosphogluconolactonase/glucosamine-6-phosphate isomerase/deaminase
MMPEAYRLEVLPAERWADAAASALVDRVRERPDLRICIPTGETPEPFYAALVEAERRGELSFGEATLIELDEWIGLSPSDPARGDNFLRRVLIDRLRVPPARFVPVDVDDPDRAAAVARHDREASALDLAIVGLGINGHVGFNEPGSLPDDPTRVVELAATSGETARKRYGASRTPRAGITIGLDRLLASGEAWLLVTGARKAEMLRRALVEPESPACPASFLRRHPRLTVFADAPAAARLARPAT